MAKAMISGGHLEKEFAAIMTNLNTQLDKIKNRTNKGLILAAIEVRRDMEGTPPLIPLDYGNLRASWFVVTGINSDVSVKKYEVKGGNFKKAETVSKLAEIKTVHAETLTEMRTTLSTIPCGVGMGFGAYYAAAVHENVTARFYRPEDTKHPGRQGSGAKFFQSAIYRNIGNILAIVRTNAQVRP